MIYCYGINCGVHPKIDFYDINFIYCWLLLLIIFAVFNSFMHFVLNDSNFKWKYSKWVVDQSHLGCYSASVFTRHSMRILPLDSRVWLIALISGLIGRWKWTEAGLDKIPYELNQRVRFADFLGTCWNKTFPALICSLLCMYTVTVLGTVSCMLQLLCTNIAIESILMRQCQWHNHSRGQSDGNIACMYVYVHLSVSLVNSSGIAWLNAQIQALKSIKQHKNVITLLAYNNSRKSMSTSCWCTS